MTDLSVTATSVKPSANARLVSGIAGATITAGQVVYLDPATNTYKLADDNLAGAQAPNGIAMNGAASGQVLSVQYSGDIIVGATLTAGTAYYLSATAGGICAAADLTTGDVVVQLGIARSTTVLALNIQAPGVTL